jgi:hypothetical protein
VYTRETDTEGGLTDSTRFAENLTSAVARKIAQTQGFMLVKNWKEAREHATAQLKAQAMTPKKPLVFTNFAPAAHRAQSADGVYIITRWHLNDNGEWETGRAGRKVEQVWFSMFHAEDAPAELVPWWKPESELRHTLDHAKTSCQHHANARALAVH